jgi:hypothetical protein
MKLHLGPAGIVVRAVVGLSLTWTFTDAARAESIALKVEPTPFTFVLTNPPFTLGFEFRVNTPITLTHLGLFAGFEPLNDAYDIGVWSINGHLLASTTLGGTAAPDTSVENGPFRFVPVPQTHLGIGAYRIGALFRSSVDDLIVQAAGMSVAPEITFHGSRWEGGETLRFPVVHNPMFDPGFIGPNFQFQPVPEPATLVLVATGIAGVAIRRRLRQNYANR